MESHRGALAGDQVEIWEGTQAPDRSHIDVAKALVKAEGDDTKLVTFNVGTAF